MKKHPLKNLQPNPLPATPPQNLNANDLLQFFVSADNEQTQPCAAEVKDSPSLRRLGWWRAGDLFMPNTVVIGLN